MLSFELCWMVSILNQQIYIHNIHLYPRYQDFLATSSVKKNCMRVEIPFFLICHSFLTVLMSIFNQSAIVISHSLYTHWDWDHRIRNK